MPSSQVDIPFRKGYCLSVQCLSYGRIGTSGQTSRTTYATPEKAKTAARKKINEKLKKEYVSAIVGDRTNSS